MSFDIILVVPMVITLQDLVSAAVFWDVMQRYPLALGGALHEIPRNAVKETMQDLTRLDFCCPLDWEARWPHG